MGKALDTAGLAAGRVALDANAEDVAQAVSSTPTSASPTPRSPSTARVRARRHLALRHPLDPRHHAHALHAGLRPRHHDRLGAQRHPARDHRHGAGARHGQHRLDVRAAHRSTSPDLFEAMTPPSTSSTSSTATRTSVDNLWVSLVPYVADGEHRPQPDRLARRRPTACSPTLAQLPSRATSGGWKGCVMAQAYPVRRRQHDADRAQQVHLVLLCRRRTSTPTTTGRRSRPASHQTRAPTRREHGAAEPRLRHADHRRSPPPRRRSRPAINAMGPGAAAAPPATSAWPGAGARSRRSWRGLWGGTPTLPLDYDTDFMEKVVVILTDGNNEFYDNDHRWLGRRSDHAVGLHRLRPRQRARSRRAEQDDDRRRRHRSSTPACSRPARR